MSESNYITIDDLDELSICYEDLYIINGKIYYLSVGNINLPLVNTWTNTYQWKPEIKIFNNINDLNLFVDGLHNIVEINCSLYGGIVWSGNIGHALLDGLYPLYLALVKFGRWNENFTFITNFWENPNMALDVVESFSKNNIIELNKSADKIFHVKSLISGTGRTGNRVMREDYTLYGKKYQGMKFFRERLLNTYNIAPDKLTNKLSPNIIIIENKRYSELEINEINKVVLYYKNKGINIEYLMWNNYKTFSEQMRRFEDVDIQVSGPGTGMNYSPFLKRGAVSVNLGCIKNIGNDLNKPEFPAYMEQSVGAGQDQISTIFYDRIANRDLLFEPLINIIDVAIDMINRSIILDNNHYVDAKIFIEYCNRVNNGREISDHLTNVAHFIEYFVNEDPNIVPHKITNILLLKQIKKEYNFNVNI